MEQTIFFNKIKEDFEITELNLNEIVSEIKVSNPYVSENELNEEIAYRLIENSVDMHGFNSLLDGKAYISGTEKQNGNVVEIDNATNSNIMAVRSQILEEAANAYVKERVAFNALQDFVDERLKENPLYQGFEKTGVLTDFIEVKSVNKTNSFSNNIFSYEPFGYEGQITTVEVDLRHGIPAVDIIGIYDSKVNETRSAIITATKNSGLEFPEERVLISVSPADLRKTSHNADLAMALSIQNALKKTSNEKILAVGEIELSGHIRPVRGMRAAAKSAHALGIINVICHPLNAKEISDIEGLSVYSVENLSDAEKSLSHPELFVQNCPSKNAELPDNAVEFAQGPLVNIDEEYLEGHSKTIEAIEVAVAGKHNLLLEGAPGNGKTLIAQVLIPYLTPRLTKDEAQAPARIRSLAGLVNPNNALNTNAPFRMPHTSSSIEGICGGGANLNPGEVSLAHNGILFLDEASEFRSSVLQMIRIPMERKQIVLARAGRSTIYPANFQLVMSANPCPCGNLGCPGKVCLDSKKSVESYATKLKSLTNRTEITSYVYKDPTDHKKINLAEVRERIRKAYEIQRNHGKYNKDLEPVELKERISFTQEMNTLIGNTFSVDFNQSEDSVDNSLRNLKVLNTMKLSLTVANLDGRENVTLSDLKKAIELGQDVQTKALKLCKKIEKTQEKENSREGR